MGSFYTNITFKGAAPGAVAAAVERDRRWAFVVPRGEFTVLFDRASERQDRTGYGLAERLSRELACVALHVTNHDDSVLYCHLCRRGAVLDSYDSCPNYFDGPDVPPTGGDAGVWCEAFGAESTRAARLADTLHHHRGAAGDAAHYVWEVDRHREILDALGLPTVGVGNGFDSIAEGGPPDGVDEADLILSCGDEKL